MSETFTSRRARRTRAAPSAVSVRHTAPPPLCYNRSAPPPCTPPCLATPHRTCLVRPAACGSRPPGNRRAFGVRLPRHVCPAVSARHASPHLSIRTARRAPFGRVRPPHKNIRRGRKLLPRRCRFGFFGVMPVLVFSALCLFCFFGVMPVCEAPCAAPPCASAARRSCRRAYRPPPPAAGRGRARC